MQIFHESSVYVENWLFMQSHVKEESLTDWLLYSISSKLSNIYYKAFSRHEESINGSDWEWWVLCGETNDYIAFRFLVQAKKLLVNPLDNYPILNYGNKNGLQIELLLNEARYRRAFPFYMFYSNSKPEISEQIKNIDFISAPSLRWCTDCSNGCFLSSAYNIFHLLYDSPRRLISDIDLLNYSFKLSLLDKLIGNSGTKSKTIMARLNKFIMESVDIKNEMRSIGEFGILHNIKQMPSYLRLFVNRHQENLDWLESEMRYEIGNLGGLGVIDLRNNSYK